MHRPFPARCALPLPAALLIVAAFLGGCGRGCASPDEMDLARQASRPQAGPGDRLLRAPLETERQLDLRLPDRRLDNFLPAFATFPYKRLPDFDPTRALVLRLTPDGGLTLLSRQLGPARLGDEQAITGILRGAIGEWQLRSGTSANRLVLAMDASTPAELAARVRRLAMAAHTWRVVLLARDGDSLMELQVGPQPEVRPSAPPPATAPAPPPRMP